MTLRKRAVAGFTLIELMIVVAIIGALAAMAIPSFMRYIAKSKTAEAVGQVRKMYEGARTYFMDGSQDKGATAANDPSFPSSQGLTPALPCCGNAGDRCLPSTTEWDTPNWDALRFAMTDPHYFRYSFDAAGIGVGANFTARANGDLDCDGKMSTFEMTGEYAAKHRDIQGSAGIFRNMETE